MSDDSDDDTPPRGNRPRSHWGDDERIAAGAKHRAPAHGVPIAQLDELEAAVGGQQPSEMDDNTAPIDLPLSMEAEFLNGRIDRLKASMARGRTTTADRITEAMGNRPPNERITAIETRLKLLYAMLAALATLALGSAITIAKGLYERGAADGAAEMRTKDLERRVEFLERGLTPDRVLHSLLPLGGPQP